jgi:hypothetical protein
MSDIVREIEEDIRRERMAKLWKRFRFPVIAIAALIILGVGGWRGFVGYQQAQSARVGDQFMAAVDQSRAGQGAEAEAAFLALSREGTGGYPVLATIRAATETARNGNLQGAVTAFDRVAADTSISVTMRDVARIRAAMLLVDTATVADLNGRLQPLAVDASPFRALAKEMMGLAAMRAGDKQAAARLFDQVQSDPDATQSMRNRAQLLLSILAGDGIEPGART